MKIVREIAERLVESLKNHPGIIPINKIKFIELLTSVEIDPTSKKILHRTPR